MKMYFVRYLLAPIEMDIYLEEILDFCEGCGGNNIDALDVVEVPVVASDMMEAIRLTSMRLFNMWKGDRFYEVGVRSENI